MIPRKRGPFGFFGGDFEDIFEQMREDMERMMSDAFTSVDERELERLSRDPNTRVYGFSMRVGPDGKPVIREFGNMKPVEGAKPVAGAKAGAKELLHGEREPLVDVIEKEDMITVIAEVPGVNKNEIGLNVSEDSLAINVTNPERRYGKLLKLGARVKPESAKAKYNNGVLEVVLEKLERKKPEEKGKKVPIE